MAQFGGARTRDGHTQWRGSVRFIAGGNANQTAGFPDSDKCSSSGRHLSLGQPSECSRPGRYRSLLDLFGAVAVLADGAAERPQRGIPPKRVVSSPHWGAVSESRYRGFINPGRLFAGAKPPKEAAPRRWHWNRTWAAAVKASGRIPSTTQAVPAVHQPVQCCRRLVALRDCSLTENLPCSGRRQESLRRALASGVSWGQETLHRHRLGFQRSRVSHQL